MQVVAARRATPAATATEQVLERAAVVFGDRTGGPPEGIRVLAQAIKEAGSTDGTKIKDAIKDSATAGGAKVVEGNLFKATVVEANRKVTDWKAIAKVCNIPEDVIIANTSVTAVFSVKTTSR